jgi:hypothetical protein
MTEYIHVFWLRSPDRDGAATDEQMRRTLASFDAAAGSGLHPWAYRLVEAGHTTRQLGQADHHIEPPFHSRLADVTAPDLIAFTVVPGLDAARVLNRKMAAADRAGDFSTIASGLYTTLQSWTGVEDAAGAFAEAIQFGTYDTGDPGDEWALADYYADVRMPAFAGQPGAVRARRLATACAAPGRTAVLYEFSSLEARLANFEPLEGQEAAARAISLTRHPALSPSIGIRFR